MMWVAEGCGTIHIMTITIDVSDDFERRLREEAARQGMEPGQYIVQAMQPRLERQRLSATALAAQESRLIAEINQGLSQPEWDRYYALVTKRRANTISDEERTELTATSERIEVQNAVRMERLAELAALRDVSLPEILTQLGILPPQVI